MMTEERLGRDTGVRKFFFFVKENVSSDWKDLAFHLGFGKADIDNIAGRNRDDKSCCMDLLEEWLKRNGERATVEALMEALSEANLQSTVDGLTKLQQEMKIRDGDWFPVKKAEGPHLKEVFQKSVKRYYELNLTYFKPLIWNDNFTLTLSDIFTQLELMPTRDKQYTMSIDYFGSGNGEKLSSLDDLFNPDVTGRSTQPRCILIEGEAGQGKTTFMSKEAVDAVSQKTELGRRHDIVLLIRLREVREGETIEEMVWDQCVPKTTEGVGIQSIRAILQRNESHVLFLLDGYDELPSGARATKQAISELLSGKMYPNSTIVITSRPSALAGVQQHTRPDCHVRIIGFSPEHVIRYVRQYFGIVGGKDLAEAFIRQYFIVYARLADGDDIHFKGENPLNSLIQTPMFLLLICVLWEEDQEMVSTGTMSGLYNNLLTCLVRKHCKREGVDMPADGLPAEVADSLLLLGKLALKALLRNNTLLDFSQVERENLKWELLLKLGVVSMEASTSKLHPRKQLNFSHKTMQEYLAGRYVAHAVVNQDIVQLLQLTSIDKALELRNLLQFTCGCDARGAQAIFEGLSYLCGNQFPDMSRKTEDSCVQFSLLDESAKEKSAKSYKQFVLLCLDILNERKEPDVLQAVSRALPVIIMDLDKHSKQPAGLKYYVENIQSLHLQNRMVLSVNEYSALHNLEQLFTVPIPGLRLDMKVSCMLFDQPSGVFSFLRNVPGLRALDMSWTILTPSLLQTFVQGFSHMWQLEELDLSENRALGDAGMEVLQAGLSSVPRLTVLRLGGDFIHKGVGMTAAGMSSLAPQMRHLVGLRELDISYNEIGDTGLESLTAVLPTFTAMQVLELRKTSISPRGMRTLVPTLSQLTKLIKLDISQNDIRDPGLECLADVLTLLTAMKMLNLRRTDISDRGISALVKALPQLVELRVLVVSGNNIADPGIVSLVQTLCQPSSMDMEQNPPGDKSLTAAPQYITLPQMHIGYNSGVSGPGSARVAQLSSALPALTRLDISGDRYKPAHLSDTTGMALAEALPRLAALEELDLRHISMDPAGFQAVVQAANEHPTLEKLEYSNGGVPDGADISACCLKLFSV